MELMLGFFYFVFELSAPIIIEVIIRLKGVIKSMVWL